MDLIAPNSSDKIVTDEGFMVLQFLLFIKNVEKLSVIEGTGSPEGVVDAETTRFYMDTTGASGSVLYIKRDPEISGDTKQGWILV